MGASLGQLQPGPQFSDVALDVPDGSACAISLAEEVDSNAEWEINVRAVTEHGTFAVGALRTRSPASGEQPARLVAVAFYPGARRFAISARQVAGDATKGADCILSSSTGTGTTPGVTPVSSLTRGESATRSFVTLAPAAGVSPRVAINRSTLYRAHFQMSPAAVAGTNVFAAIFDKRTAPVAGDLPVWVGHMGNAVATAADDPSHVDAVFGAQGLPITFGLWIASSDAAGALVVSAVPIAATLEIANP